MEVCGGDGVISDEEAGAVLSVWVAIVLGYLLGQLVIPILSVLYIWMLYGRNVLNVVCERGG